MRIAKMVTFHPLAMNTAVISPSDERLGRYTRTSKGETRAFHSVSRIINLGLGSLPRQADGWCGSESLLSSQAQ